jgi:ClpP class serine protease
VKKLSCLSTHALRRTVLAAAMSGIGTITLGGALAIGERVQTLLPSANASSRIVVVPLTGEFGDGNKISADIAAPTLQHWCRRTEVALLVLRLASTGGSGTEAERIGRVLDTDCRHKDIVALIEPYCLSACYQLAVHADRIVSSRYALVGGIGTAMQWTDRAGEYAQRGQRLQQIASGREKVGRPESGPLTDAQRRNLQAVMDDDGAEFLRQVRQFRGTRLASDAPITEGGIFAASRALTWGLIDGYATIEDLQARTAGSWVWLDAEAVGVPDRPAPFWDRRHWR